MLQSGMPYHDFLNAIIDDGLQEVKAVYNLPSQRQKLEGSTIGFESCRGLNQNDILILLSIASDQTEAARKKKSSQYWYWRYREVQIEWVLNVVNAANHAHGKPTNFNPTARGLAKAADILRSTA